MGISCPRLREGHRRCHRATQVWGTSDVPALHLLTRTSRPIIESHDQKHDPVSGIGDGPVLLVSDRPCTRQYGQGPLPCMDPVRLEFIFAASSLSCEYQAICHRYIQAYLRGSRPIRSGSELARMSRGHIPRSAICGKSMDCRASSRESGRPIHARPVRQDCPPRPYIVPSPALFSPVSIFSRPTKWTPPQDWRSRPTPRRKMPIHGFTNGIAMRRLTGNMKKYCVVTGT